MSCGECIEFALQCLTLTQVLKIAILSEKYASDFSWYVDIILKLIRLAGDYVSEEVWYRIIQIVINRDDVQGYAAKTCFEVSTWWLYSRGSTRECVDVLFRHYLKLLC